MRKTKAEIIEELKGELNQVHFELKREREERQRAEDIVRAVFSVLDESITGYRAARDTINTPTTPIMFLLGKLVSERNMYRQLHEQEVRKERDADKLDALQFIDIRALQQTLDQLKVVITR